ncbi:DeoR/GlpR family DNA-binding transcription regulator [Eubacteriales bacterium OttesenSCG-928-K08]|nr:DeoR/GlpR family DNA-binding transcription regulator [Eubacteriales bacterium OttesenSCG-928-K08]
MGKVDLREERLLEELRARGQMDLKEIAELFGISDSTARRMCVELERKDLAIRTFGGLRALPENGGILFAPYSYADSENEHTVLKARIGRHACKLVEEGDILFLSGGTTVQQLALALAIRIEQEKLKDILILTNSIACAEVLGQCCSVTLTGGKLRPERRDVAGFLSEQMVKNARFDKCFIGVDGIDLNQGVMAFDMDTANLDRMVTLQSDTVYILADSSKFSRTYFTAYESFLPRHKLITDENLSPALREIALLSGITLEFV